MVKSSLRRKLEILSGKSIEIPRIYLVGNSYNLVRKKRWIFPDKITTECRPDTYREVRITEVGKFDTDSELRLIFHYTLECDDVEFNCSKLLICFKGVEYTVKHPYICMSHGDKYTGDYNLVIDDNSVISQGCS